MLIGKNGFYKGASLAIDKALDAHELVKIKFREFKDKRREIGIQISSDLKCEIIGQVGNTITLKIIEIDTKIDNIVTICIFEKFFLVFNSLIENSH